MMRHMFGGLSDTVWLFSSGGRELSKALAVLLSRFVLSLVLLLALLLALLLGVRLLVL